MATVIYSSAKTPCKIFEMPVFPTAFPGLIWDNAQAVSGADGVFASASFTGAAFTTLRMLFNTSDYVFSSDKQYISELKYEVGYKGIAIFGEISKTLIAQFYTSAGVSSSPGDDYTTNFFPLQAQDVSVAPSFVSAATSTVGTASYSIAVPGSVLQSYPYIGVDIVITQTSTDTRTTQIDYVKLQYGLQLGWELLAQTKKPDIVKGVGGQNVAWTTPAQATANDNSYAILSAIFVSAGGDDTDYLEASKFGFALSADSSVISVVPGIFTPSIGVSADGHLSAYVNSVDIPQTYLLKNSAQEGAVKSTLYFMNYKLGTPNASDTPFSLTIGNPYEIALSAPGNRGIVGLINKNASPNGYSATFTPTDVNATGFGFAFRPVGFHVTSLLPFKVNYLPVTVWYLSNSIQQTNKNQFEFSISSPVLARNYVPNPSEYGFETKSVSLVQNIRTTGSEYAYKQSRDLDTGLKFPGVASNVSLPGVPWFNIGNIGAVDNLFANVCAPMSAGNPDTDFLVGTGFLFSFLPTDATQGVQLIYYRKGSANQFDVKTCALGLLNNFIIFGNDRGSNDSWTTINTPVTIGSETDLFGLSAESLSANILNSNNFGVYLLARVSGTGSTNINPDVDAMQLRIYYSRSVSVHISENAFIGANNSNAKFGWEARQLVDITEQNLKSPEFGYFSGDPLVQYPVGASEYGFEILSVPKLVVINDVGSDEFGYESDSMILRQFVNRPQTINPYVNFPLSRVIHVDSFPRTHVVKPGERLVTPQGNARRRIVGQSAGRRITALPNAHLPTINRY